MYVCECMYVMHTTRFAVMAAVFATLLVPPCIVIWAFPIAACMYVCIYICMYICMYEYIYMNICMYISALESYIVHTYSILIFHRNIWYYIHTYIYTNCLNKLNNESSVVEPARRSKTSSFHLLHIPYYLMH